MKQLTLDQRYKIQSLLEFKNHTITQISEMVQVHKSSISRELKRNCPNGVYDAKKANKLYLERCQRPCCYKLKDALLEEVISRLSIQYSPEQISGRLKLEGNYLISHECIYKWVYKNKEQGGEHYLELRQSHKKRHQRASVKDRRGIIPNKTMIDKRPAVVDAKQRFGDFEGDTIIGANHQGAIVTLTERVSKLLLMEAVPSKTALEVEKAIVRLLRRSPIKPQTITFDNGTEFSNHESIAKKLNCDVFFARPYHSWQRGLNENTNGLIRQYIPKKTCFIDIPNHLIKAIEKNLNNRPRKTLNYFSPLEYIEVKK